MPTGIVATELAEVSVPFVTSQNEVKKHHIFVTLTMKW